MQLALPTWDRGIHYHCLHSCPSVLRILLAFRHAKCLGVLWLGGSVLSTTTTAYSCTFDLRQSLRTTGLLANNTLIKLAIIPLWTSNRSCGLIFPTSCGNR